MSNPSKNPGRGGLLGIAGVVVVLGIMIAVNVLANSLNLRLDLTEDKIYTLSEGTKNIISNLDTPVTLRFYVSEDARSLPQEFKNLARRTEDFLLEYKKESGGKIRVEKFNVKEDTDEEDSAALDGIRPAGGLPGQEQVYFGISVDCLGEKMVLPYIPARPETLLEYDLSRAISQVVNPEKPRIAVMTSLEIAGGFDPQNFQAGPKPTWIFYDELKRDYFVSTLGTDVEEIKVTVRDDDGAETEKAPDVLIVLHPHDIQPQAEYAIDQYLLAGGKVIALVDPMFFTARALSQAAAGPMMPPPVVAPVSTLEKLFEAWGVEFDATQVVADLKYRTGVGNGMTSPAVLSLVEEAINREDPVTAQLQAVSFVFAGGFLVDGREGIKSEVLLASSPENQLISPSEAEVGPGLQTLLDEFSPSGVDRAYALRLSGKFKTAYPEGKPGAADEPEDAANGEKEGEDKKTDKSDGSLTESAAPGVVVLFADADFVYDQFAAQAQQFMGRRFIVPINSNLSLIQNAVEQLAGDANLIGVRSRSSTRRPFTKINEMESAAEQRFSAKIREVEKEVQDTQERLNGLQMSKDENQKFVLSAEQQAEIENLNKTVAEKNRELREVRKDLRREIDSLLAFVKAINMLGMPLIVILVGIFLAITRRAKRAAR